MRSTILSVVFVVGMSLTAFSQTNEWELRGDAARKSNPELSVELYAEALIDYKATVMRQPSQEKAEPYLLAMERVLSQVRWGRADAETFKQTFMALRPVLNKYFHKQGRKEIRKELTNKYRLLRKDGEEDDGVDEVSLFTNVVQLVTTKIKQIVVEGQEIAVFVVGGLRVVYLTAEQLNLDLTDIPANIMLVTRIAGVDIPVLVTTKIKQIVVEGQEIAVFVVGGLRVVYLTAEQLNLDLTDIPANIMLVTRIAGVDIPVLVTAVEKLTVLDLSNGIAAQNLAFAIMGERGLFVPHVNSPLGWRYKALRKRIESSEDWSSDPAIIAEWKAYWKNVRSALDRRARMSNRRR